MVVDIPWDKLWTMEYANFGRPRIKRKDVERPLDKLWAVDNSLDKI